MQQAAVYTVFTYRHNDFRIRQPDGTFVLSPSCSGRARRFRSEANARTWIERLMTTHGGQREGAGRPKTVARPIRRTVYFDQQHVELITRHQKPGSTFSQALRELLDTACQT